MKKEELFKPELITLGASRRLALTEGQKENDKKERDEKKDALDGSLDSFLGIASDSL